MKKTRTLVIMVVVLVVLIGAFALSRLVNFGTGSEEETSQSSVQAATPLLSLNAEEVDKLIVSNSEHRMEIDGNSFVPTPTPIPEGANPVTGAPERPAIQEWTLSSPSLVQLDQQKVNSFANSLMTITSIENIGKKTRDEAEEYGIAHDNPQIQYYMEDGTEHTILLGKELSSTSQGRYYAYNPSTEEVAVVTSVATRILSSPLELLDNSIVNLLHNEITTFSLERIMDDFVIQAENLTPLSREEITEQSPVNWQMHEPVTWSANLNNLVNFLSEVGSLSAHTFVAQGENLSTYGLDNPQYILELNSEAGTKKILFGQNLSDEYIYAMDAETEYIFTVNRSSISRLGMPAVEFFDSFAALVNVQDVGTLTVELGEDKYTSEIFHPTNAEKEEDNSLTPTYTLDGKDANVENENNKNAFSRYYQAVIGVTIAGFDLEAEPSLENPEYRISYTMRNEKEDIIVEYVERSADSLYLFKNGEYTGFYVYKSNFEDTNDLNSPSIRQALNELLEIIN